MAKNFNFGHDVRVLTIRDKDFIWHVYSIYEAFQTTPCQ